METIATEMNIIVGMFIAFGVFVFTACGIIDMTRIRQRNKVLEKLEPTPIFIQIDDIHSSGHFIYFPIKKHEPSVGEVLNVICKNMESEYHIIGTISSPLFSKTEFELHNLNGQNVYHFFANLHAKETDNLSKTIFQTTCSGLRINLKTAPTELYWFQNLTGEKRKEPPYDIIDRYIASEGLKTNIDTEHGCFICYPQKSLDTVFHTIQSSEADIIRKIDKDIQHDLDEYQQPELQTLLINIQTKLDEGQKIPGIETHRWVSNYLPAFQTLCKRPLTEEQLNTCKTLLEKVDSHIYNPKDVDEHIDTTATISAMQNMIQINLYEQPIS